jgi:adenylate kinase
MGLSMRLILLGPPGSGKGTQAQLLCQRLQLEHVGTGDILREAIRLGTPAGKRAEPYVKSGKLVPDDLVNDLVADRFRRADRPTRFVMDGYPRTSAQAKAFDQVLQREGLDLTGVVSLAVDDAEIVRRLAGRWSCPQPGCKATYHTANNPPETPGICDRCGTRLVQRDDDKEETVKERLRVYHGNTAELIPYYRARGLIREVPGHGNIEEIYANILRVLNCQAGSAC